MDAVREEIRLEEPAARGLLAGMQKGRLRISAETALSRAHFSRLSTS